MMLRTLTLLVFSVATGVAWASSEAGHEGIPTSVWTHCVNFALFASLIAWALFSKVNVSEKMKSSREETHQEIQGSKQEIEKAEGQLKSIQQRISAFDIEAKKIREQAAAQAQTMASRMKEDAEKYASKLIEDAKVSGAQELDRLKKKVVADIVHDAVEQSAEVLRKTVIGSKDEEVIQRRLKSMDGGPNG